MPIELQVDPDHRYVVTVCRGHITTAELREHVRRCREEMSSRGIWKHLVDLREVDSTDDVVDALIASTRAAGKEEEGARTAIVGEDDLQFGLGRMYEGLSGPRSGGLRVFRGIEEARRWLESGRESRQPFMSGHPTPR
jgi:hypothetical protein